MIGFMSIFIILIALCLVFLAMTDCDIYLYLSFGILFALAVCQILTTVIGE